MPSHWLNKEHQLSLHTSREYVAILVDGHDFNHWPMSQIARDPEIASTIARTVRMCCLEPHRIVELHQYEQEILDA